MVVDVGDFDNAGGDKKEDRAVFFVDAETEKSEVDRFQEFNVQTRMREVLPKQLPLFIEFLREVAFLEIPFKLAPERKNNHRLAILEVRGAGETLFEALQECRRIFLGGTEVAHNFFNILCRRWTKDVLARNGDYAVVGDSTPPQDFVLCFADGHSAHTCTI